MRSAIVSCFSGSLSVVDVGGGFDRLPTIESEVSRSNASSCPA
jgi:hypothetical protein